MLEADEISKEDYDKWRGSVNSFSQIGLQILA